MNLFLSWSKERSQIVAEAFHEWIQCVIQKVTPFYSPKDISGGMVWVKELNSKLANSNAGIIFLTPENQNEPWIQFEAGALAKGFSENRVFVLLIGLEDSQVEGPLSNFNLSKSDENGLRKIIFDINNLLGEDKINSEILAKVFDKNFPDLQKIINEVISKKHHQKEPEKRSKDEIQNEMLNILRGLSTRISNVEHSIIQNKGLVFTNSIPSAPEQIPDSDLKFLVRKNLAKILEKREAQDREVHSSSIGSNGI